VDAQADGGVSADFRRDWEALKARIGSSGAPAFNFSSAETPVFIDRTAPILAVTPDFPRVVKGGETFRAGYRAIDASAVLPDSKVKVAWSFSRLTQAGDLTGRIETMARAGATQADAPEEVLGEEPGFFRLEDGRYRFSMVAEDGAGNSRTVNDPTFEFSVDRTKPVIAGLFPRRQTYRRGDAVILDFSISEEGDTESNRTGLHQAITLTIVEPDGVRSTHAVAAHGNGRYSVELPVPPSQAGTHTALLRVRDWAGNDAEDATVFGVDRAVTRISTPGQGAVVDDMIGLYGLAGSPDYARAVPFEYYELSWSRAEQNIWSTSGMQVPSGYRSQAAPAARSMRPVAAEGLLGFWNPQGLAAGGYDLRLCSHAGPASECDVHRVYLSALRAPRYPQGRRGRNGVRWPSRASGGCQCPSRGRNLIRLAADHEGCPGQCAQDRIFPRRPVDAL
jgi:hypothetical protein